MSSKTSNKSGKVKKKKPFNRLDKRFQLTSEHPDDHVFPEEMEIVVKLRETEPRCRILSDKMMLTFVFCRRHIFVEVLEVLRNFFAMADRQDIDLENPPACDDPDVKSVISGERSGWSLHRTGAVDIHNRMVYYYIGAKDNARDRPPRITYKFLFWELFNFVEHEKLSSIRNGQVAVIDTEDITLKAISLTDESKQLMKDIQGTFPKRNHEWVVIDAGIGFRLIWTIGKVLLSKKMKKRVKLISSEELRTLVPVEVLHPKWGGTMDIDPDKNYT